MATHSNILAWKILWTEELSMGLQSRTWLRDFTFSILMSYLLVSIELISGHLGLMLAFLLQPQTGLFDWKTMPEWAFVLTLVGFCFGPCSTLLSQGLFWNTNLSLSELCLKGVIGSLYLRGWKLTSFFIIDWLFSFWLCWIFVAAHRLLYAVSGAYSLVSARRLLSAVASHAAEHGLQGAWASVVACSAWTLGAQVQ